MNDKLDKIPEEIRARIAAELLKSIGAGPIQAPGDDDDSGVQIVMEESDGLMAFLAKRQKPQRRPATATEVRALNRADDPPLKVGDRVRWKPGLRSGEWPDEGEAAIVSQIIAPPLYDTTNTDESGGAQRNDIALAFADETNEAPRIFEFVYDSRRFERVNDDLEDDGM